MCSALSNDEKMDFLQHVFQALAPEDAETRRLQEALLEQARGRPQQTARCAVARAASEIGVSAKRLKTRHHITVGGQFLRLAQGHAI